MRYETLKTPLTLCSGTRKGGGQNCNGTLHKCKQCGAVGCQQNKEEICSDQVFSVTGQCVKCQTIGQMETMPAGDYATQQAWLHAKSESAH